MAIPHHHSIRRLAAAYGGLLLACPASFAASPAMLTVAMPPAQAQQAILREVQQLAPQREEHRRYRMALPFGAPLFPSDADFSAPPVAPELAAWLALPAAQRRYDLLLTPDIDYYWRAEGRQYSCQFLIHIEAQGAGAQLALLQLRPTEYAGKRFELLGRTGPGSYVKLLPATPSAETGAALRTFLAATLARPE